MTPFSIRWNFDGDGTLQALFPELDAARIRRLYFEDAARQWQFVVKGWPSLDDGTPLCLPSGVPLSYLSIDVKFVVLKGGAANEDVARVDIQELLDNSIAGPRSARFPYKGTIRVDLNDMRRLLKDRPRFKDTIVHEIGHVLGLGTLFEPVLVCGSGDAQVYTGTHACRAYEGLLGAGAPPTGVPLQAVVPSTVPAFHWDECALPREIMSTQLDQPGDAGPNAAGSTPKPGSTVNVISLVSAGALKDLGYEVDMTQAAKTAANRRRGPGEDLQAA